MAKHAHTTPATLARRRHVRAAPGAVDRRCAQLLREPVTAAQRARIERDVDLLLELLDTLDGDPDLDGGYGDEDCCEAGDDDPASRRPSHGTRGVEWGPGDPDDAEPSGDECEPSDAHEFMGDRLTPAAGHNVGREWWGA